MQLFSASHDDWCSCRDYVRGELESGFEGPLYLEPLSMNRFTTALIGTSLQLHFVLFFTAVFVPEALLGMSITGVGLLNFGSHPCCKRDLTAEL